jgi:hypothetical protein
MGVEAVSIGARLWTRAAHRPDSFSAAPQYLMPICLMLMAMSVWDKYELTLLPYVDR